ncbi:OsmC family protein [Xanthobacter sp. KR7-65]|uniref:OsmC family protein n=1 Tax=Xanthobacter sp. KR7-65 TaxID=3156612 RepID=UPI0032B45366
MAIIRTGSAEWSGGIKDGKGKISTESGALAAYPYGFASRFEGQRGSNPEELLGAAHAACFTMALSLILGEAGLTATALNTSAKVSLEKQDAGYAITKVDLVLTGTVPGATPEQFEELAGKAKANCPLSKVIRADISLEATLEG